MLRRYAQTWRDLLKWMNLSNKTQRFFQIGTAEANMICIAADLTIGERIQIEIKAIIAAVKRVLQRK